ncbi:glutathione S-transferase family protein [Tropicimonas sp. IMCC6043]|uniref:glutathione S-transferase family protein n=1 Tax=Tropicimonas sp. IMCC6043 TaxID=2510645 RepID=UPI00101C2590|nr:glutathione S-transferase N-terminal domain-containing protein [Tropicimonas sp. IMCC6043]RYH08250.1 glutathione S-transferase [Tropicimonas sp. IMCC6043]
MTRDLSAFPITARWPAEHPDRIQLYSFPTPNGLKISIALEELGLPYEAHRVTLKPEDVKSPEFVSLNPNGKIPAIIDPNGPDGAPIGLFESGAILLYLAEKTGKLLGDTPRDRHIITQWLMFQMSGIGPMFGQFGFFFAFGGRDVTDPLPLERYRAETLRLLQVLETRLSGREWIADTFSIADIAMAPWLRTLEVGYHACGDIRCEDYPSVFAFRERFLARPAVQRGLLVPPRD